EVLSRTRTDTQRTKSDINRTNFEGLDPGFATRPRQAKTIRFVTEIRIAYHNSVTGHFGPHLRFQDEFRMDLITLEPLAKPAEPTAAPAPTFEWVGGAAIPGRTRVYGGTLKPEVADGAVHVSLTMPDFARLRS